MARTVGGIRPNAVWLNETGNSPGGWGHSASAPVADVTDGADATYAYNPVNYPGYGGTSNERYVLYVPLSGVPTNRSVVVRAVTFWSRYNTDNYNFQSQIYNGTTLVSAQGFVGNGWQAHTWIPGGMVWTADLDLRVGWQVFGIPWGPQFFRVNECYVDITYDYSSRISMII